MIRKSLFFIVLFIFFTGCLQPKPRKPLVSKTTSYLEKSVQFNKQLNLEEELFFKEYIKKDSLNTYIAAPNGFWYTYLSKSKEIQKPQKGDIVQYFVTILDSNNRTLYTKKELGLQQYVVDKQDKITGLSSGLKLMSVNDEIQFLFPSHLAYGYLGNKDKIKIKQPLIYKVKLKKIIKKDE